LGEGVLPTLPFGCWCLASLGSARGVHAGLREAFACRFRSGAGWTLGDDFVLEIADSIDLCFDVFSIDLS